MEERGKIFLSLMEERGKKEGRVIAFSGSCKKGDEGRKKEDKKLVFLTNLSQED